MMHEGPEHRPRPFVVRTWWKDQAFMPFTRLMTPDLRFAA